MYNTFTLKNVELKVRLKSIDWAIPSNPPREYKSYAAIARRALMKCPEVQQLQSGGEIDFSGCAAVTTLWNTRKTYLPIMAYEATQLRSHGISVYTQAALSVFSQELDESKRQILRSYTLTRPETVGFFFGNIDIIHVGISEEGYDISDSLRTLSKKLKAEFDIGISAATTTRLSRRCKSAQ